MSVSAWTRPTLPELPGALHWWSLKQILRQALLYLAQGVENDGNMFVFSKLK